MPELKPDDYSRFTPEEHVLYKPSSYIGSILPLQKESRLVSENLEGYYKEISFAPGLERVFLEILSNALDHTKRSMEEKVECTPIKVLIDEKVISIENGGIPMCIDFNEKENLYVPQLVFGNLMTSENYNKERTGAGTNGIGAKATNIFSKNFSVYIENHNQKKSYNQSWKNNMKEVSEPIIENFEGKNSKVIIKFELDFEKFQEVNYRKDVIDLFRRHCVDASFNLKIPLLFNNVELNYDSEDFKDLFFEEKESLRFLIQNKKLNKFPYVEFLILDTPKKAKNITFVNGMETLDGGVHLNYILKLASDNITNYVNSLFEKELSKDLTNAQKKKYKVDLASVKPHISVILCCWVENPEFNSQSKTFLVSPKLKFTLPKNSFNNLKNWKLVDLLKEEILRKLDSRLSKTDGKPSKLLILNKGQDSNFAKKKDPNKRLKSILCLAEGDSASGYILSMVKHVEGGRDIIGILPMKGKGLNVMNATISQIEKNPVIIELKQMLGLCEGVDYTDEQNFRKLRYGSIYIVADADNDGKHIEALILNLFHCRYPSLLKRNYVKSYLTPMIKARKGKKVIKFYNKNEFNNWLKENNENKNWKVKYYKGLGTSTKEEIKEDYKNKIILDNLYDKDAPKSLELAFNKNKTNERKDWILKDLDYNKVLFKNNEREISSFVNNELILYSKETITRSLPSMIDGLKECQRKIIAASIPYWDIYNNKSYNEKKVAQFTAYVAEKMDYHHGETILSDVLIKLAQNFVGSNNLPWFCPKGLYGTRVKGGNDASSARYLFTTPQNYLKYIIRKEDNIILEYNISEDGFQIEPKNFFPIIPMSLINGCEGIATGWSTFVPNHNIKKIISWIKNKIKEKEIFKIEPFYNGFKGEIQIIEQKNLSALRNESNRNRKTLEISTIEGKKTMRTLGSYEIVKNKIVINELPIRKWGEKYSKFLEKKQLDGKIKEFSDHSNDEEVKFVINGFKGPISFLSLELQNSFGLGNMYLLNEKDIPILYKDSNEILESFFQLRLRKYEERKEKTIPIFEKNIKNLEEKIKVIEAIVEEKIIIMKRKQEDIKKDALELGLDLKIINDIKIKSCTKDCIDDLNQKYEKLLNDFEKYKNTKSSTFWLRELEELEKNII